MIISKRIKNNIIVTNSLYTFLTQAANYILPVLVIPYITRVLGSENFGKVAYTQSLCLILSLITDYGFTLSATRDIAQNKNNISLVNNIVNNVINVKIYLIFFSYVLLFLLFNFTSLFKISSPYYYVSFLLVLSYSANTTWFFLGIEKLRFPTFIVILFKLFFVVLVFILVKQKNDGAVYLLLFAITNLIGNLINNIYIYKNLKFRFIKLIDCCIILKESFSLFFFKVAVSLYTSANNFILGSILEPSLVGVYAGAEKLVKAIVGLWMPLSNVIYPRINYLLANKPKEAQKLIFKTLIIYFFSSLLITILFVIFADFFVKLFLGENFIDSIQIMQVLAPIIVLIALSNVTGILWLLPRKKDKEFNTIIVIAGILNILFALILVKLYGPLGMAYSVLIAESFVTLSTIILFAKSWRL